MSCQQAPRLTEDPYTFTESPITTTYFTSQKLPAIKSVNQLSNQPKYLQTVAPQQVNRFNGSSNGKHKPIYFKQVVYQPQPPQPPQQQIKFEKIGLESAANVKSKSIDQKLILPSIQETSAKHLTPNKPKISHSKIDSKPELKTHPSNIQITKLKAHSFINHSKVTDTPTSAPPSTLSSSSPSSLVLTHTHNSINSNATDQNKQKIESDPILRTQHSKYEPRNVENVAPKLNEKQTSVNGSEPGQTSAVVIPMTASATNTTSTSKTKYKNGLNSFKTSINDANASLVIDQQSLKLSEGGKSKKLQNVEKIKKAKNSLKIEKTKKKLEIKNGKSQVNGKRKRSYSQTTPHEALQRIWQRPKESTAPTTQPSLQPQTNASSDANVSKESDPSAMKTRKKEWHAPESYIYDDLCSDDVGEELDVGSCTQAFWFREIPNENLVTREQKLESKRDNLRRQAFQYAQAQNFRSKTLAKRRLITVTKALAKFQNERNKIEPMRCSIDGCSNDALAMTAHCYLHITLNTEQKLFHPCTAKFSDNSQCRVPVFDISHELPLCREHAWKRDNYNRMIKEQKPKRNMKKKIKPSAITRLPKRNIKKKKQQQQKRQQLTPDTPKVVQPQKQLLMTPSTVKHTKLITMSVNNLPWNSEKIRKIDSNPQIMTAMVPEAINTLNPKLPQENHELPGNTIMYQFAHATPRITKTQQHDLLSVCENSSAYESSDTGVGGLSESELINTTDGIEIPLGDARLLEEHDLNQLTNVLNQLPEDAFNELFEVQQNDTYEPTQKEQDELARALEEVDEQVKSLAEQMTGSNNFLDNFLNVDDEILVNGADICTEVLTTPTTTVKNDIRGLVHT